MVDSQSNQISHFQAPENLSVAIIGLGYVGLPLAVEFARKYKVKGFDISHTRIGELENNYDRTQEISADDLESIRLAGQNLSGIVFTSVIGDIQFCNVYIISVPTPTDNYNRPDLSLLKNASEMVGGI